MNSTPDSFARLVSDIGVEAEEDGVARPTILVDMDSSPRGPTALPKPPPLPDLLTFEPRLRASAVPERLLSEIAYLRTATMPSPFSRPTIPEVPFLREVAATIPCPPRPTQRVATVVKLRLVRGMRHSEPPTAPPPPMRRAA